MFQLTIRAGPKEVSTKGVCMKRSDFHNFRAVYAVLSKRNFQKSPFVETLLALAEQCALHRLHSLEKREFLKRTLKSATVPRFCRTLQKILSNASIQPHEVLLNPHCPPLKRFYRTLASSEPHEGFHRTFCIELPPLGYPFETSLFNQGCVLAERTFVNLYF